MRVAVVVTEVTDGAGLRIQDVETLVECPGPDPSLRVDEQRADAVTRERARILRIVLVVLESVGGAIPVLDAAAVRGQPQIVVTVLGDGPDVVTRKPAGVTRWRRYSRMEYPS
jgi:hypothetical protein